MTRDGTAHAVLLWWQLGMVDTGLEAEAQGEGGQGAEGLGQQEAGEGQQPLLLSTAPGWVGPEPGAGGDGGPLGGTEQRWRDHWKQCWVQVGARLGRLVGAACAAPLGACTDL